MKTLKNLLPLLLLLFLLSGLIIFFPIKETFTYSPDEGINAVKASLFLKGFPLYKQIWSDQPPLFTALLAGWFKLFGPSFYHGRILVLLFLGLLLWAFFQTIRLRQGALCAWCGCAFLLLSVYFLRLGASIMVGLPSWALAMSAVYLLTLYNKTRSNLYLFFSGLFMALSLLTKFSPAFLIPAMLFELTAFPNPGAIDNPSRAHKFSAPLFWLFSMVVFYFIVTLVFFYPNLNLFPEQLFRPHLTKLDLPRNNPLIILRLLSQDIDIVFWALAGIIINFNRKKSGITLPFLWLCSSLIVLLVYRPTWDHYYLFISLPLCWLAAIGATSLIPRLKKHSALIKVPLAGLIILTLAVIPLKVVRAKNSLWGETNTQQREILRLISEKKDQIRWIATDLPEYAFYSGIPVLPEIAVPTVKRRFINGLIDKHFIATLQKYEPELLLLGGFQDYPLSAMAYIKENYLFYARSQVSARTKGYLYPGFFIKAARGNPGVPFPRLQMNQREFYSENIDIEIFLRKDKSVRHILQQ